MRRVFLSALWLLLASNIGFASWNSKEIAERATFDQKLGSQVPLNLSFKDETGRSVKLADYFGKKPVILNLVYYQCPSLCTEVLNGLVRALRTPRMFKVGQEFNVVTLSINPRETPVLAQKKAMLYRTRYNGGATSSSWPFLSGEEASIRAVADAVGFGYAYDSEIDQYAHASGLVILTPDGKASRYLYGVEYSPKDIRMALSEASQGKIGGLAEKVLLYCYRYDPASGRYGVQIMRVVRWTSAACAMALGLYVFIMIRRERYA